MKLNWGTGIVLAFIAFISFIMYFVIRLSLDHNANHELVSKTYYKEELAYQEKIDAEKNSVKFDAKLKVKKSDNGLRIEFPENFEPKHITGKVSLYRPSNRHLDVNFPISLSNSHLLIPDDSLIDGRWDIAIAWYYKGETFLHKEKISY